MRESVLAVTVGACGNPASVAFYERGEMEAKEGAMASPFLFLGGHHLRQLLREHFELLLAVLRLRASTASGTAARSSSALG